MAGDEILSKGIAVPSADEAGDRQYHPSGGGGFADNQGVRRFEIFVCYL